MKDEYYLDPRIASSYDRDQPGQDGDVEFYRRLALESAAAGLPVLELGCGTGRVSIPIALAGVKVAGLDRSPAMLDIARAKSAGIENVRWVEGDMADFKLGESFGLVFIPFRSFLHLMTVAEQKSCLAAARRHLVDGGRLALNFFNPDLLAVAGKRGVIRQLADQTLEGGTALKHWAARRFDRANQELTEDRVEERLSESGAVISRVYRNMRLRYVFRFEMEHLFALSGFEIEALYGGFQGEAFIDESSEMVWVARKA